MLRLLPYLNQPTLQSDDSKKLRLPCSTKTALGRVVCSALIALTIFVAAILSQHLTVPPSNAAPVWPVAGIALALTILYGPRALIGIFIGVVVFEFQLFSQTMGEHSKGSELILALALGGGACAQAVVGAKLVRGSLGPLPSLTHDVDILRFQLLGGPVACLVSASIGMITLLSLGVVTSENLQVGWLTWWVGDVIGVVIFAPLVLIFFDHADPLWHGRKTTVALPMLLLFCITIAFYSYADFKEGERKQLKFQEVVRSIHHNLTREFQTHLEKLESLKSYFDASNHVTRDEFRIVNAIALKKHVGIQALEWIKRVKQKQRGEFERMLPQGGSIRRLNSKGVSEPAESREEYYAIQFIEPQETNMPAFGFDITSNPIAAEALFRARDSGETSATGPLRLIQETADDVGIVLYKPVYSSHTPPATLEQRRELISGVVAVVVRLRSMIDSEIPSIANGDTLVRLLDNTNPATPRLLYSSHQDISNGLPHALTETRSLEMAGRSWGVEYVSTPEFLAKNTNWAVWLVLTGGLLITALLGTGLLVLTGRTLHVEDEVNRRTTELRSEVRQRRNAETQLRLVLDGANLGFWDWNYQTGEQLVNNRWLEMLGLSRNELKNDVSDWTDRIHPDEKEKTLKIIEQRIKNKESYVVECRMRHQDGHWVWIQAAGAVVTVDEASNLPLRLCGTHQDISERKDQEEHILRQAHFDSLTELPNRFLSLDRLYQLLNEAQRKQEMIAVLFLDLDDFKKINDTLGHDTGDKLLTETATRLETAVRDSDTVGRLGGDEFIILLSGISQASDAQPVAEAVLSKFTDSFRIDNRELVLTASIGISIYPDDGDDMSELLRNADSAMYHSKEQGRNTYSYFTETMNEAVSKRLLFEEQMHGALDRGEFELCYQPQVELASGRIIGVEALLRWDNPALGKVPPLEFIPIAEQTGLIVAIGKFVITEALTKAAQWWQQLGAPFTLAVNLSPRQFRDPNLEAFIQKAIEQSGMPASVLELEITEGVLMSGHANIDHTLAALNNMGVSIAMDDFGTGYSSLSYLRNYPFDVLKIDREFIQDLTEDHADRELVNATIMMAHGLGLKVIAEGVETEKQRQYLSSQGCDFAQGFLFSKPLSPEEISDLIADSDSI
jgi:diguanylate cyclase (GGDEF)-like protein/PAS domain S-box-containing protein